MASRLWNLETTPLRGFERILPQPSVHVIVNLSDPYRVFGRHGAAMVVPDAFVSGVQSDYLILESPPTISHVGVELPPAALPLVTDAAPAVFAGRVQDARALWPEVDEIVRDIRAAATPSARIDALSRFVGARRTSRVARVRAAGIVRS